MGQIYEINFSSGKLEPIIRQDITIGQLVYQAHKGQSGIVCEPSQFGYTVIYADGSESHEQQLDSRSPFTRIQLKGGIASPEKVAQLKALRDQKRIDDRNAQAQAKNQHQLDVDRIVKELRAKYPWVKKNNPSANIKKELTMTFPSVKFSVRSERNTVNISWFDGPTSAQVEAITDKYENGRFDGMTDCHEYDHSAKGEAQDIVLGRATYVFPSRSLSPRFLRDIVIQVCFDYNHELPLVKDSNGHAHLEGANQPLCKGSYNDDTLERKIYQVARETAA